MSELLIPLVVAVVIFVLSMTLLPKSSGQASVSRRKEMLSDLERMRQETIGSSSHQEIAIHDYTMEDAISELSSAGQAIVRLPGALSLYRLVVQAGMQNKMPILFLIFLVFAIAAPYLLWKIMGPLSILAGIVLGYFAVQRYLTMQLQKRMRAFMDRFADGIDMIVRAVKAGNPVNTALRLVAEHGESPVKDEFRILVDEVTYGRPLVEALARMAKRVPEYDVSFFVVVLTIQQETGGNLGEVLGKLSHIIRKRQELFLKVRAITSEGRASSWILGALAPLVVAAIYFTSPEYLDVMFTTTGGNIMLCIAVLLEVAGFVIIRKMAEIEV
jgi:tight adherence protein B